MVAEGSVRSAIVDRMPVYSLGDRKVEFDSSEWYVAPGAHVMGSVRVGHQANVWFNVVIRGDNERITIGERCNIQDGAVLHADPGIPLTLAREVSVGHKVMLHGCTIGEASLIGMNATLLNRCVIGKHCIVGAGALIPQDKTFPDGVLILGAPGKVVRDVTSDEIEWIRGIAEGYVKRARRFAAELRLRQE
jgi:carbonic anhydrase/acetyltransferase-like protein (isoleucine patch superfamily)